MVGSKTHIRNYMGEARAYLKDTIAQVQEDQVVLATENPHWRVRDILAHLAGSEAGMLHTVSRFLSGDELPAGFTLDYWNQRQVAKRAEADLDALMMELKLSREQAFLMLDQLDIGALAVQGTHPAGFDTTVAGLFYTIANHEIEHANEIRRAIQFPITSEPDWNLSVEGHDDAS